MTKEYIEAGFDCDRPAKLLVENTLTDLYRNRGLDLVVDRQENNSQAPIDLFLTAITKLGEYRSKAAIELKERPDTSHTQCEDWIVEPGKIRKLKAVERQGYKPLYCYLWSDGYMALWDINNWDYHFIGTFNIKPHTMGYAGEEKKTYDKYGVTLKSAIWQGYVKQN